jgi:hypothetical protein
MIDLLESGDSIAETYPAGDFRCPGRVDRDRLNVNSFCLLDWRSPPPSPEEPPDCHKDSLAVS